MKPANLHVREHENNKPGPRAPTGFGQGHPGAKYYDKEHNK